MPASLAQSIANLEKRSEVLRKRLVKHPSAKKFYKHSKLIAHDLRQKSTRLLAGAGLIGTLLTTPIQPPSMNPQTEIAKREDVYTTKQLLLSKLQEVIPHQPTKLTDLGARKIENLVYEHTQVKAKAFLEGQSLNHHLGFMGFEQHLKRFPGDSLSQHDSLQEAGMAPGLGAFGYFSSDPSKLTTKDYMREKYYVAVQTLYLENWNQDFNFLKEWYKFRKVLVINPANGQAVVAVVGDAGPAEWTGKQFGGSPEVMESLNLHLGPRKGMVLMMFVDDPNNLIPLGPINY